MSRDRKIIITKVSGKPGLSPLVIVFIIYGLLDRS
jgi:hypothetical protein